MKKRVITIAAIVAILTIQCFYMFCWGTQKEGMFVDELFSYGLANDETGNAFLYTRGDYLNTWHDGSYYANYLTVDDESRFAMLSVISNQEKDVHPVAYYFLINFLCSVFTGSFSKWIGIGLNIVCFALAQILLYMISAQLIENRWMRFLPMVLYGFSMGAVNAVLYIRMYMMLTMQGLLLVYLLIRLLQRSLKADQDGANGGKWNADIAYVGIYFSIAWGLLTQYYYVIYAFFACAMAGLVLLFHKKILKFFALLFSALAGIGSAFFVFPYMYKHIFSGYRGTEAVANLKTSLLDSIITMEKALSDQIFGGFFPVAILLMCLAIAFCLVKRIQQKKTGKEPQRNLFFSDVLILIGTAGGYFLVVSKISTYSHWRYIAPVYPLFVLSFATILCRVMQYTANKKVLTGYAAVVTAIGIFFTAYGYKMETPDFLYRGYGDVIASMKEDTSIPLFYDTTGDYRITYYADLFSYMDRSYASTDDVIRQEMANAAETSDTVYFLADFDIAVTLDMDQLLADTGYTQYEDVWLYYIDSYASGGHLYKLTK